MNCFDSDIFCLFRLEGFTTHQENIGYTAPKQPVVTLALASVYLASDCLVSFHVFIDVVVVVGFRIYLCFNLSCVGK